MSLLADITIFIETASRTLPLPSFIFWASLMEELIAPIPAFFVILVAAPLARAEGYTIVGILVLAALSAFGKTLGAWVYYILGDKAEDWVTGKWGRRLGISHEAVAGMGLKLGKGLRDEILLVAIRAIPLLPSTPFSVLAGVVKIRLRSYLLATFAGFFLRNVAFLFLAQEGFSYWKTWVETAEKTSSFVTFLIVVGLLVVGYSFWSGRSQTLAVRFVRFFRSFMKR